jgi:hypothetical protein
MLKLEGQREKVAKAIWPGKGEAHAAATASAPDTIQLPS